MKNKIYFASDIFPVFFVVFFLFTILWTNCNKIVFTQIPKALSVLVLGKKQSVLESQINLENFLWPVFFFFLISISFFHKFYQKLLYIKTQISSNYPPFPSNCGKTKSNLKKRARENFLNLSGFPKHSLFFS